MGALRTLELAGQGWGGVRLKLQPLGQRNGFASRRLQRVFCKFCPGPLSGPSPGEARRVASRTKGPGGGGWPQNAQRIVGGAGIGVAPIGAVDARAGAFGREGSKPKH
jgi:hypothetical protein